VTFAAPSRRSIGDASSHTLGLIGSIDDGDERVPWGPSYSIPEEDRNMRGFKLFGLLLIAVIGIVLSAGIHAGTLEDVKKRGKILAGVRFDSPPYGSVGPSGKVVGFDVDLAAEIAGRLGVGIEYVQVTGSTRIPMLESGKIDMLIAATTHTRQRDQVIDFTIRYFTDGQKILVKKGTGIAGVADIGTKTVATVQGTTIEKKIRELAPQARILVYQEWPQAFLAAKQGLAQVVTASVLILGRFAREDANFEVIGEFLSEEPIAIGVRHDDSKWRDALNFALQDMASDGAYARIFNKWVGKDSEFNLPLRRMEVFP